MKALGWMLESTDGNNKPTANFLSWLGKPGKKRETVSASAATAQTRAGVKESDKIRESGPFSFIGRFRETAAPAIPAVPPFATTLPARSAPSGIETSTS